MYEGRCEVAVSLLPPSCEPYDPFVTVERSQTLCFWACRSVAPQKAPETSTIAPTTTNRKTRPSRDPPTASAMPEVTADATTRTNDFRASKSTRQSRSLRHQHTAANANEPARDAQQAPSWPYRGTSKPQNVRFTAAPVSTASNAGRPEPMMEGPVASIGRAPLARIDAHRTTAAMERLS